jgi:hypothetical protein
LHGPTSPWRGRRPAEAWQAGDDDVECAVRWLLWTDEGVNHTVKLVEGARPAVDEHEWDGIIAGGFRVCEMDLEVESLVFNVGNEVVMPVKARLNRGPVKVMEPCVVEAMEPIYRRACTKFTMLELE